MGKDVPFKRYEYDDSNEVDILPIQSVSHPGNFSER